MAENRIMSPRVATLCQGHRAVVKNVGQTFTILAKWAAGVGPLTPNVSSWKESEENQWPSGQQMTGPPWGDHR